MPETPPAHGPSYWRRLPAPGAETQAREFPDGADVLEVDPVSRREFLGIMGASLALAGLAGTGCSHVRKTPEAILPYARRPEDLVPGNPLLFATGAYVAGTVLGLLVESQEGRPTKIEGNPAHPMSQGRTSAWAQAEILGLYDPDRSTAPRGPEGVATIDEAVEAIRTRIDAARGSGGLGVVLDGRPSRTRARLLTELQAAVPGTRLFLCDPLARTGAREGARLAGAAGVTLPDLGAADVIASFDCDFLGLEGDHVRNARAHAARRVPESGAMNRLFAVEARFSLTGAQADHRLRVRPSQVVGVLAALAQRLGADTAGARTVDADARFLDALADDLRQAGARALVLVGDRQPPAAHALAHRIHERLGSLGTTVRMVEDHAPAGEDLAALSSALHDGSLGSLLVLGANPVLVATPDLGMADAVGRAAFSAHLGLHDDETGKACTWHVPAAHWLESWDDLVASDGTLTACQPLIDPMHPALSDIELLARVLGGPLMGLEVLRATWGVGAAMTETAWSELLRNGAGPLPSATALVAGATAAAPSGETVSAASPAPAAAATTPPDATAVTAAAATATAAAAGDPAAGSAPGDALRAALQALPASGDGLEAEFVLDMSLLDGRYANNAWLQELPDPMTKMTWENVASLSPATASRLGVEDGDMLELSGRGAEVTLPAMVLPGLADEVVVLALGYGRTGIGRVAEGAGTDVQPLRHSSSPWFTAGVTARATGRRIRLATTQMHGNLEETARLFWVKDWKGPGRHDLVRETTARRLADDPGFVQRMDVVTPEALHEQLYENPNRRDGQQWGMAIDLSACTGCSACTIACQAENNIPVVGRDRVMDGREMHWIRVDRYFRGNDGEAETAVHQPVPCMQCETAPCEQVCPVAATVHSDDGLNDMVYNRCIGTRYCANNCPYKVRRFNFFNFAKENDELFLPAGQESGQGLLDQVFQKKQPHGLIALQRNPDVTVRFRGVMEKCTYCVQRIRRAGIDAKIRGEDHVADGAVLAACQQACPADAIHFGDINDSTSVVSRSKASVRNYAMLAELRTLPRTTYLARVRNPHPALAPPPVPAAAAPAGHGQSKDSHG